MGNLSKKCRAGEMRVDGHCVKACIGEKGIVPCSPNQTTADLNRKNPSGAFARRIADAEKVPLAPAFVHWVRGVAAANNLTEDEVWSRWQEYDRQCRVFDQSALTSEFLEWQKLKVEGIRKG